MYVFYCPMPMHIPRPDSVWFLILFDFFSFFLNQEDTLSWLLLRKKLLFPVTWSVSAILGASTNTKYWQQQSKLLLFSSWVSQVWLALLSGNENITELNHCETLLYILCHTAISIYRYFSLANCEPFQSSFDTKVLIRPAFSWQDQSWHEWNVAVDWQSTTELQLCSSERLWKRLYGLFVFMILN